MSASIRFIVIALLIGLLSGFVSGWTVNGWRHAAAAAADTQQVRTEEKQNASAAAAVDTVNETQREQVRTVYKIINRKVIEYAQASAPDCTLSADWVRLHDAAALSELPGPASQPDASAASVTAAEALGVIAGNYESCADTRQRLIGLQRYEAARQAAQQ